MCTLSVSLHLSPSLAFIFHSPILCKCYNYLWIDFQRMILHNGLQTVLCKTPTKLNPCSASILHVENLDWGEKGLTSCATVKGEGEGWEARRVWSDRMKEKAGSWGDNKCSRVAVNSFPHPTLTPSYLTPSKWRRQKKRTERERGEKRAKLWRIRSGRERE